MTETRDMMKKICVIGEAAVGKTSLIRRFVVDKFDDRYIATIGTKTTAKKLQITNDEKITNLSLQIWDILGVSSFAKTQRIAYKRASGALLVLDLTRRETLYSFDLWLFSLYEVAGEIPVVVLANKNDLKPEYGKEEIEELVREYGFPFYLTSAKTGENVDDAFHALGEMMIKPWAGPKIKPKIEMSKVFERGGERELDKKLTALEAEDMIMARYCELFKDTDIAMAIIREQIKRVGMDFRNPTVQGLAEVVDYLINAASDRVESKQLEKERRNYTSLIGRIGRGDGINGLS